MVNQQKGVQQDTAYSAVVAYVTPSLPISFFHVSMIPLGSILLHSFLLIYHPYPPSFHEMIFILVPLIFLR